MLDASKTAGDILNFIQDWIYTTCYYEVAIIYEHVFRYRHLDLEECNDVHRANKRRLAKFNGFIYVSLFCALLIDFLTKDLPVMRTYIGLACCFMFVLLFYSYKKLESLINALRRKGLQTADTVIGVQLVCIAGASILKISQLITSLLYSKDCTDDIVTVSSAGVVETIFEFIIVVLQRIIVLTMVIFFLKQTERVPKTEL